MKPFNGVALGVGLGVALPMAVVILALIGVLHFRQKRICRLESAAAELDTRRWIQKYPVELDARPPLLELGEQREYELDSEPRRRLDP